jgi:hypothetical protein
MEQLTPQSKSFISEKIQELQLEKEKCQDALNRISFISLQQMLLIEIELIDVQINLLKTK